MSTAAPRPAGTTSASTERSSVQSREIGAALQRALRQSKLTQGTIAGKLGWRDSKTSRMVTGYMAATGLDVAKFLVAAEADPDEIDRVSAVADLSPQAYSVQAHPVNLPDMLPTLLHLGANAHTIISYQPHQLPHLTQTAGYTETLLRDNGLLAMETVRDGVAARQKHQTVLSRPQGPATTIYINETALRRSLPSQIATEQRHHFHALVRHPRCHLRILPAAAAVTTMPGFTLFEDDRKNQVVTVFTPTAMLVLDNPNHLAPYQQTIAQLASRALPETGSVARLLARGTFGGETTC
ncbi:DUF5753 domain-containing protein [Amycolatopsis sp. lyj-108]|uniref:DUF5753 domain-containing protein n=1 Tax=Amycolatopsis sp. lyj-108 TaxID=2789286 RepID=UPI00397B3720